MSIAMNDNEIIRELAQQYMEIANEPVNAERRQRAYLTNGLKQVRPLVWMGEIPWGEFDECEELRPVCSDPWMRNIEIFFRRTLYQWRHFQGDMVVEPYYPVYKAYDSTGDGLSIVERTISTNVRNNIVSHDYEDQLDTLEKLDAIKQPIVTPRPDKDAQTLEKLNELLGGIMPVRLLGHACHFSVWDRISMYRSMANVMADLADKPELMHETARRLFDGHAAEIRQMNTARLYTGYTPVLHVTPGYSRELEANEKLYGGTSKCTWLRVMAQPFASVSPKMHYEYDIAYTIPIAKKFGLVYYGCCEPLSDRLDVIKKLPNLRKVGVSPWSDVEKSAEALGKDYVFARKPNPALVVGDINEEAIRCETEQAVRACIKYGCPYEFVLKDISSVSGKPQNLARWTELVEGVIDKYY